MTKNIQCDRGWSVQSDSEDELVANAEEHAREIHKMVATREQLLAMAKPV
jgi:predicted small metal-binding protein